MSTLTAFVLITRLLINNNEEISTGAVTYHIKYCLVCT